MLGNLKETISQAVTKDIATPVPKNDPKRRSAQDLLDSDKASDAFLDIQVEKGGSGSKNTGLPQVEYKYPQQTINSSGQPIIANGAELATNSITADGKYGAYLNPHMDEVYAAHELGHILNRQGKLGGAIRDLRDNPALTKALAAAGIASGAGYALGNEGNDDIDEAALLAVLGSAPTLIDEAGASITGLDLMNRSGSRASLGQRGKLAGAFMTYLTPAIVGGLGAATVANVLD